MPYIFGPSSLFWSLPLHKSPQKLYPFPHTEIKGSVEYDKNTRLKVCDIVKVTINFKDLVPHFCTPNSRIHFAKIRSTTFQCF